MDLGSLRVVHHLSFKVVECWAQFTLLHWFVGYKLPGWWLCVYDIEPIGLQQLGFLKGTFQWSPHPFFTDKRGVDCISGLREALGAKGNLVRSFPIHSKGVGLQWSFAQEPNLAHRQIIFPTLLGSRWVFCRAKITTTITCILLYIPQHFSVYKTWWVRTCISFRIWRHFGYLC